MTENPQANNPNPIRDRLAERLAGFVEQKIASKIPKADEASKT